MEISRFLSAATNMREPHMYYSGMTFNMSVTEKVGRPKLDDVSKVEEHILLPIS